MKKKGIQLLGETSVKIIMSVLALIILFFLISRIYAGVKGDKTKTAEKELEKINYQIESVLETGEERTLVVFPSEGWFLKSDDEAEINDADCIKESCLCFCEDYSCNGLKACIGFDFIVEVEGSYTGSGASGGMVMIPNTVHSNIIEFKNPSAELRIYKDVNIKIEKVEG